VVEWIRKNNRTFATSSLTDKGIIKEDMATFRQENISHPETGGTIRGDRLGFLHNWGGGTSPKDGVGPEGSVTDLFHRGGETVPRPRSGGKAWDAQGDSDYHHRPGRHVRVKISL